MAIDVAQENGDREPGKMVPEHSQNLSVAEEDEDNGITEIESLCMNCHGDGVTKLKILRVPYFREILLESFSCEECGFRNSTIKSAGEIQEKGSKFTFRVDSEADLQRQVVKNDSAIFRVEDLELEMPSGQGQLTNVEGIMTKISLELQSGQQQRRIENPKVYEALEQIIKDLTQMLSGALMPFTISLDDPSGNSLIEPSLSDKGAKYTRTEYPRSHAQNISLGLAAPESPTADPSPASSQNPNPNLQAPSLPAADDSLLSSLSNDEIYTIPSLCPGCSKECTINIKKVNIPHFKEVVIMSTVCEHCGYTTREVKTGGAIPDRGQRVTLHVRNAKDLSRDILKSETCALRSVELGLEVQPGTLGGRFTTVEGLLSQVRGQLRGQIFDVDESTTNSTAGEGNEKEDRLRGGDSMSDETKGQWDDFFGKLDRAINAEMEYSLVLEDPLASSFVQSLVDDGAGEDPQIVKEDYERTEEEMDELGLNHMKTEGYDAEHKIGEQITSDGLDGTPEKG